MRPSQSQRGAGLSSGPARNQRPRDRLIVPAGLADRTERSLVDSGCEIELCGLLGGISRDGVLLARALRPLRNLSKLADSFAVDPEEFLSQCEQLERVGLEALALYHSHRHGSALATPRDLELPRLIGLPVLIVAIGEDGMRWHCFCDRANWVVELPVVSSEADDSGGLRSEN